MTTTRFRARRLARILLRLTGVGIAINAGWTCQDHHLSLLLTLTLVASLFAVWDQAVTRITIPERSLSCPKGCGVTITAPADLADRYQHVLDEHVRTTHPAPTV